MEVPVHHYEAFSAVPGNGNPAGVVLDACSLSEETMQAIALKVGFNETAFVLPSDKAECRIRFFTPGHEIPLCGHATVATIVAMYERLLLRADSLPYSFSIETKAGVLPITIRAGVDPDSVVVVMKQALAEFFKFQGDRQSLADALGVQVSDLHPTLPIVFGSTGTWTLIVPTASLSAVATMKPSTADFPNVLTQMPRASIHPFSTETDDAAADLHGRHFSSPYSGTIEDPITGTASGVMGAYIAKFLPEFFVEEEQKLIVEQGVEVDRDGRIEVTVLNREEPFEVCIAGTGVYVKEMTLDSASI